VFFNEIQHDNIGIETGESIEPPSAASTDLTGDSILLYKRNQGTLYRTLGRSGLIPALRDDFGVSFVVDPVDGGRNGAPDGMDLMGPANALVQFLSHEGNFIVVVGASERWMSTYLGVGESSTPRPGQAQK
jgi:hypothetical protein